MICIECKEKPIKIREYCDNCYKRLLYKKQITTLRPKLLEVPIELTKEQEEILIGSMLGDGCLYKHSKFPSLQIVRCSVDKEYIYYGYNAFEKFCGSKPVDKDTFDVRTNKTYYSSKFATRQAEVFKYYYDKWYINKIKIVPKDLQLTPLICAIWFCDDGCVCFSKNCKNNRMKLKLSTHGFTKQDVQFLIDKLNEVLNCPFYICNDNGKFFISASDFSTKKFIAYIDKYIPNSMSRKRVWDGINMINNSLPHIKNRGIYDIIDKYYMLFEFLNNQNEYILFNDFLKIHKKTSVNRFLHSYKNYINKKRIGMHFLYKLNSEGINYFKMVKVYKTS